MYSFLDIQFWLFFLLFFIAVFFSIYIPGYYWIKKISVKSLLIFHVLSFVLGFVIWAAQGYIFGYLNLRFLTYVYVVLFFFIAYRERENLIQIFKITISNLRRFDKVALIFITIGMIVQSYPVFMSGMLYTGGVRFFDVNATDGVLHLGYIQSMIQNFPPIEPGINSPLINYHYWSDLVLAELARVWKLPVMHLFFQYIPPLLSVVTGFVVYGLVRVWGGNKIVGWWALFLIYFSGDMAFSIMLLLHQKISFSTPAIDNGVSQLLNLPNASAKLIFITSLISMYIWVKEKSIKYGVLTLALFSVLVGFKVYFAIYVAIGLSLLLAFNLLKSLFSSGKVKGLLNRAIYSVSTSKSLIGIFLLFLLISALIYFPPNKGSGGLFFAPLEWSKLFLSAEGLNLEGLLLQRESNIKSGNLLMSVFFNISIILISLISIYGTRLIGLIPEKNLYKHLGFDMIIFMIPGVVIFNILGFYTLQESGLYNVFNFFVVSTVVLTIFSAFVIGRIHEKGRVLLVLLLCLVVILTVPRSVSILYNFTSYYFIKPSSGKLVSNSELQVFRYIRDNTPRESIVQTHLRNSWDQESPYTVFFTQRNSFLTGTRLLETHNQPTNYQKSELEGLFDEPNSGKFAEKMVDLKINYVIIKKDNEQTPEFPIDKTFLKIIFENQDYFVIESTKGVNRKLEIKTSN